MDSLRFNNLLLLAFGEYDRYRDAFACAEQVSHSNAKSH